MPIRKSARLAMLQVTGGTTKPSARTIRSSRKKADATKKPRARGGNKTRSSPKTSVSSEPGSTNAKANKRGRLNGKKSSSRSAKGPEPEMVYNDELKDSVPEWEVEEIVDSKKEGDATLYLVKWVGYPENKSTWEPESNLQNSPEAIQSFNEKRQANDKPDQELWAE